MIIIDFLIGVLFIGLLISISMFLIYKAACRSQYTDDKCKQIIVKQSELLADESISKLDITDGLSLNIINMIARNIERTIKLEANVYVLKFMSKKRIWVEYQIKLAINKAISINK